MVDGTTATSGNSDLTSRRSTLGLLRRKVALAVVVHFGICFAWVTLATPRSVSLWLIGAIGVAAYFAWLIWNPPDDEPTATHRPSPRLGIATTVTLARVSCLSLLSGYLLSSPTSTELWHLAGLYAAIGAGDWLDGFLARRTGHETRLGEVLDLRVDIVGMFVAAVLAVVVGRLPPWYLLLGFAAVIFHGALALRRASGRPCYEERLRPSAHTRTFAGYQMAVVAAAFVPLLHADVVRVVATLFMVPSLAAFLRDWLVVTGGVVPDTESYRRFIELSVVGFRNVAPVLLRPIFAVAAVWTAPADQSLGTFWVICALTVLLGWMPRLFVFVWLVTVGLAPSGVLSELLAVSTGSSILLLGSGYYSLYQPEEQWFFGRHGTHTDMRPVVLPTTK